MRKLMIAALVAVRLMACPFDEENHEPTVDAYVALSESIAKADAVRSKALLETNRELYLYFQNVRGEPILSGLEKAVAANDTERAMHWLGRSVVIETEELLDQAAQKFERYNEARLLLVKAKKHLELIMARMGKKEAMQAKKAMRKALKSLGNPGVMGVGKRAPDPKLFAKSGSEIKVLMRKTVPPASL